MINPAEMNTLTLREPLERWTYVQGTNLLTKMYHDPTTWTTTF